MSRRSKNSKSNTAYLTSQDEATPEEIEQVRGFLDRASSNLYGGRDQLTASEVQTIAQGSVLHLHKRPRGHR